MSVRVYSARWVLPIVSQPIPQGAVAVEGDRIIWVGPAGEAPEGRRIDLGNAALMPGLVNTHAHLELTAMRGFLEDVPFREWIVRLTRSRASAMSPERRVAAARVGLAEGLLAGVTTFADVSDSGLSLGAMRGMQVRGIVYHEVFGPDPAQCDDAILALRARLAELRGETTSCVGLGVSPHAPYTVSDALFRATAALAREEGLPITVHVAEGRAEHDLVTQGSGEFGDAWRRRGITAEPRARSPIQLLADCGVLDSRALLIHAVHADERDRHLIRDSGASVAHCPASNAKLGHGIAPITEFLAQGSAVGLGSDSVASGNRMDLLDDARLAVFQQRIRLGDPAALPAAEVLRCATLGGARALGLDAQIGTLEVGKQADLAAFSLDDVADTPVYAPESALVFARGGRRAILTMVGGRELVRDGGLLADVRADQRVVREAATALSQLGDTPGTQP